MRTIEKTVFKFSELSEAAKDNARSWFVGLGEFNWADENQGSIETFCDHFGVALLKSCVGPHEAITFETDAENKHFRGRKLRDFKRDHMPTGYCRDCDIWQTFYDEFKHTGDAKHAFEVALWAGFKGWRADMEDQLSDEYIDGQLIVNEYEFTEDGEFFRG